MSFRTTVWRSTIYLACARCSPSDIVLCLKDGLILQDVDNVTKVTINAQVLSGPEAVKDNCSCGGCGCSTCSCDNQRRWQYTIFYDDLQLVEGTILKDSDITGAFCRDCRTKYTDQEVQIAVGGQTVVPVRVVSEIVRVPNIDFKDEVSGFVFSFDLVIANPSASQILRGSLTWGWRHQVQSSTPYEVGVNSDVGTDGIFDPDTGSGSYVKDEGPMGISFLLFSGAVGAVPVDIAPGDTATYTLRLTRILVTEPDGDHTVQAAWLNFFGVTTEV